MEEEIIIVIKPRRADAMSAADAMRVGVPSEAMPTAYAFKSYEAAVKFLAASLKG